MALQQDIDGLIASVQSFVSQTRLSLNQKANDADVYTKTEVDLVVSTLASKDEVDLKSDVATTYTKTETDLAIATSLRSMSEVDFFQSAFHNSKQCSGIGFSDLSTSPSSIKMSAQNPDKNYWMSKYLYLGNRISTNNFNSSSENRPIVTVNGINLWICGTNLRDAYVSDVLDKHISISHFANIKLPELPQSLTKLYSSNLTYLEVWVEDISTRGFVYPFGNTQFSPIFSEDHQSRVATVQELVNWYGSYANNPKLVKGDFSDADSYSLFGSWDTVNSTIGYGYKWSDLTVNEKSQFVSSPYNNIFVDSNGVVRQVRYKFTTIEVSSLGIQNSYDFSPSLLSIIKNPVVIKNSDDSLTIKDDKNNITSRLWKTNTGVGSNLTYPNAYYVNNNALSYIGLAKPVGNFGDLQVINGEFDISALNSSSIYLVWNKGQSNLNSNIIGVPIALTNRRNRGIYHPVYNPYGSAAIYKAPTTDPLYWYEVPENYITSLSDCFDFTKVAVWDPINTGVNSVASRMISGTALENVDLQPWYYVTGTCKSTWSGRDDYCFSDSVESGDVLDLRINVNPIV